MTHVPVMISEVLQRLSPSPGEVYVDCTAGLGGHASAVASRLVPGGTVVLNDVDPGNLERASERVRAAAPGVGVVPMAGNFADVPRKITEQGLRADMVLADLGFASGQVDDASRGLSFSRDGPLDMRLDPTLPVTAAELVATLTERELAEVLRTYGEEREAGRIARKLVREREVSPITTTGRLAGIVRSVSSSRSGSSGIDPATRTFQALRIAVNDEIGSLEALLAGILRGARSAESEGGSWLRPGARVVVISFHSLEDRPVKRRTAELVASGYAESLTRGPMVASEHEVSENPRSRSARLRGIRVGRRAV
ncbi:MAG: 16S rRNA (cytosine(1402)-N(4))-methyltransferase RsmH [Phycisphaeraceae bacterium]|nr:16S rRNA (cytosine(1402)-N(4))-methyltransferase RsmH [Phycisphaeraceae bacterium]HRJ48923.1 16S rRNA (cytosine(1402)-N(4))-methyltransferase RsmH [Phycisphaerales bacterium]